MREPELSYRRISLGVLLGILFLGASLSAFAASYSVELRSLSTTSIGLINCSNTAYHQPPSPFCSAGAYPCYTNSNGTIGTLNITTGAVTGGAFFGNWNINTRLGISVPLASYYSTKICQSAEHATSAPTYTGNQHYTMYWNTTTSGVTCPAGKTYSSGYCIDTPVVDDAWCQDLYDAATDVPMSWNKTFASQSLANAHKAACGTARLEMNGPDLGCYSKVSTNHCSCLVFPSGANFTTACKGYGKAYAGDSDDETTTIDAEVLEPIAPIETTVTEDEISLCTKTVTKSAVVDMSSGGVASFCTEITTVDAGASCSTAGDESTIRRCTNTFPDGSTTTTTDRDATVGGTPTQGSTTTSSSGSGAGLTDELHEDEEGNLYQTGDCAKHPVCEGDALQCGIIDQQWKARCDFANSSDDLVVNGDGFSLGDRTVNVEVDDVVAEYFTDEGWLGSSSCPTLEAAHVMGLTLNWNLSGVCNAFTILSYLIMGIAGFVAGRILLNGLATR